MSFEPLLGAVASDVVQVQQKIPIGIELAHGSEPLHHVIGVDGVNQHTLEAAVSDLSVLDELGDESNSAHLSKQRRIEADLVDAVYDLLRGPRYFESLGRVDVNHDDVRGLAAVDQRKESRIAHIAAVPKIFSLDLDRLGEKWQARGREHARH